MPSLNKASKRQRGMPRDRRGRFAPAAKPGIQHFRLLDLPSELRNMIYGFAMISDPVTPINRDLKPPPLTQVSRQIRNEALLIYWQKNQFVFTSGQFEPPKLLARWLRETKDIRSRYLHPRKLLVINASWVLRSDVFLVLWIAKHYPEQSFLVETDWSEHRHKCEGIVAHLRLSNVCISGSIQEAAAAA